MSGELNQELDRLAISASIPAGAFLFRNGEPVSAVYLIRRGSIELDYALPDGSGEAPLAAEGQILGLPAALNGAYCTSARALEDSMVGYVPVEVLQHLLEGDAHLCLSAARLMSEELAHLRSLASRWK